MRILVLAPCCGVAGLDERYADEFGICTFMAGGKWSPKTKDLFGRKSNIRRHDRF